MTHRLDGLLEESRQLGFLGPGPIDAHIGHARAFAVVVEEAPGRVLDLGAGGGLPGLVLAAEYWPEATWVFLDAQARRSEFLQYAVEELRLEERVTVVTERAEAFGRRPEERARYDLVVSRSFGAPAITAECAAPLLRPGGLLVVSEPPSGDLAARWPAQGLEGLGLGQPTLADLPGPPPAHLAVLRLVGACPDRYPRRVGIPAKRPLF